MSENNQLSCPEHSTGPAHFRLRLEEFNGGEYSLRNNRGVLFGIFLDVLSK